MKSPYQIAKEMGISPQAVYQKINTKQISILLEDHLVKDENGKMFLNETGEKILKDSFNTMNQINESDNELIKYLKSENQYLKCQLENQTEQTRKQNDQIVNLAEKLAEITKNNQILLKSEQDKNFKDMLLIEQLDANKEKIGFFQKLFGK